MFRTAINLTKLVPPVGSAEVPRSRILAQITNSLRARLVSVIAPAGFGKSTLLAQLLRNLANRLSSPCWVSLDAADGDPTRFALYLVEAVRRIHKDFGQEVRQALESGLPVPAHALLTLLLNEFATLSDPLYIALDDYHLIAGTASAELLREILLAPLPQVIFLVASRAESGLPLSRLRVQSSLCEVTAEALKFSIEETSALLALDGKSPLENADITLLQSRTEGWVAGLQLAAIALRQTRDVSQLMAQFTGAHRDVGDFLADEVLKRQRPAIQSFLIRTAILSRFNADLCAAVTGQADSRALLDEMASLNLFLFSLDTQRGWYRYHHLFGEFLTARLTADAPQEVPLLHRRAAQWLIAHDQVEDALEHAISARDYASAGAWLDQNCQQMFGRGLTTHLRRLTERIPNNVTVMLPRLQLVHAWDHMLSWRFDAARDSLEAARRAITVHTTSDAALQAVLAHREMMVALTSDDLPTALRLASAWLADYTVDDNFMRASAGTAKLHCEREMFQHDRTVAQAAYLRELFVSAGADYGTVFHDSIAAVALIQIGELAGAEATLRRAAHTAVSLHGPNSSLAAMPSNLLASLMYERGEFEEARDLIDTYAAESEQLGLVDTFAAGRLTEARLAFRRSEFAAAECALRDAHELATRHTFARLESMVLVERVRQQVLRGDNESARARLLSAQAACRLLCEGPIALRTVQDIDILCAWSWVATGQEAALTRHMLQAALNTVSARRSARTMLVIQLALAGLAARSEEAHARDTHLIDALELAAAHGFLSTVLDAGVICLGHINSLPEALLSAPAKRWRAQLQLTRAREAGHPSTDTPPLALAVEPMTARELDILQLAAQSLINREIAVQLHLSETTIKWYWRRILQKLNVQRRQQAIRRSRELGLIR